MKFRNSENYLGNMSKHTADIGGTREQIIWRLERLMTRLLYLYRFGNQVSGEVFLLATLLFHRAYLLALAHNRSAPLAKA